MRAALAAEAAALKMTSTCSCVNVLYMSWAFAACRDSEGKYRSALRVKSDHQAITGH
jgi:hypothetical protein